MILIMLTKIIMIIMIIHPIITIIINFYYYQNHFVIQVFPLAISIILKIKQLKLLDHILKIHLTLVYFNFLH